MARSPTDVDVLYVESPAAEPDPRILRPSTLVTLATCSLNQWALDFTGNLERVMESIRRAKKAGCVFRLGPELELSGYGCEDHFLESDTELHCWQSLAHILQSDATEGILVDIGMPVTHRGVRYNCRVSCLNHRILLVRPKIVLADDGNYRESRWFGAYHQPLGGALDTVTLPTFVGAACGSGQQTAPFGVGVLRFSDGVTLASETCEELFAPAPTHIALNLDGVDVVANGSGSHHELRKLSTRVDLIHGATTRGGVYLYANQRGCDGGRLYFDGCALIVANGDCVAQGAQFGLADVEVTVATVDIDDGRSRRSASASRSVQASSALKFPRVEVPLAAAQATPSRDGASAPRPVEYVSPAAEVALGPACWLWDFLRRSGASGYFLPLSGGADSAATAAIVGVMCRLVHDAAAGGEAGDADGGGSAVLTDLRRVLREGSDWTPTSPAAIASRLLHTAYLSTEHSSEETRARAAAVAADIGAYHVHLPIDAIVAAVIATFVALFGSAATPRFASRGGSRTEDVALQNVQARLRMVVSYVLAQLLPWVRGHRNGGFLLVLGSANVDEALRGYLTKYDCSSADVNPIGGVSKGDLRRMLLHAASEYGFTSLRAVAAAAPTAELQPGPVSAGDGQPMVPSQLDEVDMGMTYDELGVFGCVTVGM